MKNLPGTRFGVLALLILITALSRLLPHPPNATPMIALALFGGAYFNSKKQAFLVPLVAMLLSDIGLDLLYGYTFFTPMRIVVYSCFVLITAMGFLLKNRVRIMPVLSTSFLGSLLFFIISNFGVWQSGRLYSYDINGLVTCYMAAIPYFNNMVLSSFIYSGILFGGFELAKYRFPVLEID